MSGLLRKILLVAPFAALAASAGGCAAVAWIVAQTAPPRRYPAKYELPEGKKVLVFVDDYRQPVNYEPIKEELARRIAKEFTEHEVAVEIIPYERLEDLAYSTRRFREMGIPSVAKKLGAEMVVYVDIRRFSLKESPQSPLWQGRMEVDVKVVDPEKGTVWPKDRPDGYPVIYADREPSDKLSAGYGVVLAKMVAALTARKLAKLFYERVERAKWFGDKEDGP